MGLGDGAGERLVVRVDYHLPPLDEVLELPDGGGDGQELPIEGGVLGLGVGESTAEERVRLEPPPRWCCSKNCKVANFFFNPESKS